MISIVCDVCKKAVPNAMPGKNFIYVTDKAICKSCEAELEEKTRAALTKDPQYSLAGFQSHYLGILRKMCG
ncbi:hypothetical protein [Sediminispirochaeta bajacaliforniensis]|uniref:hypothetical protein n=1 Tax=Sediminispirochaeta bajacaliforniensis TaxID=148 RepID=UPI0003632367|nr:hypothetical protein [Sediminispirochaeta bajacaliforniensis]